MGTRVKLAHDVFFLQDVATMLRILSIEATTAAGSGHPTSCASSAEIMSALFFSVMRTEPPDHFVLSKGHAAPLLYAAFAEAGMIDPKELLRLRRIDSVLEGHPTPRVPFVEVATGSLGQGLAVGVGFALDARYLSGTNDMTFVLMGDGETAEGSVWEAAAAASHYGLGNLCAIVDVNRLGQSEPTMLEYQMARHRQRWGAFGWDTDVIDGHDMTQVVEALESARSSLKAPTVILAKTIKGQGIPEMEGEPGHHGKALDKNEAARVIGELRSQIHDQRALEQAERRRWPATKRRPSITNNAEPFYTLEDAKATRQAIAEALAALGDVNSDLVVLDGDVKNSTYTELFEKKHKDRFFQMFIAEQNMIGTAMGLAARGRIPFAATFACFLSRAYDFARMAAISNSNIKLIGTHAGISIGEDGPSQMGLEDFAMFCAQPNFTVLYPSDATSAWRAAQLAIEHDGPVYIRTSRPKTRVVYGATEPFEIGKCRIVRQQKNDQATIVAGGVTLFEALEAHEELCKSGIDVRVIDLFSVQPVDRKTLLDCIGETAGRLLVVEDHYVHGGLGDAVSKAVAAKPHRMEHLAVREIPRSGAPEQLMDRFGISARHIVEGVRRLLEA